MNLRLLGIAALVVVAVFLLRPFMPASYHTDEPLADSQSLARLIAGEMLARPSLETRAHTHR